MIPVRRLRLGLLVLAAAVAGILLAAVLLQVFSRPSLRARWDWTRTGRSSLSERTAAALAALPEGSQLTAFLFEESPALTQNGAAVYPRAFGHLRALLEDARLRAAGRLEVLVLDRGSSLPAVEEASQRLRRQPGESLILSTPEQRQVLRFEHLFVVQPFDGRTGEPARLRQERVDDALGDAALRLARARLPRIGILAGFLQGVRERPDALRPLAQLLQAEGFEPVLLDRLEASADLDLLLVPGQTLPLLPSDATEAARWLEEGRPILIALGAAAPPEVAAFWNERLRAVGVSFEDGLVCQPVLGQVGLSACQVLEIPAGQMDGGHDVTRSLAEAGRRQVLQLARPVRIGSGSNAYVRTPLLWTGSEAWVDRFPDVDYRPDGDPPAAVVTLAVAAERLGADPAGRVLVLGCGAAFFGQDLAIDRDLVAAALRWLLGEEDRDAGLVAVESLPFRLDAPQRARLANLALLAIPGATFLLGVGILMRRRR